MKEISQNRELKIINIWESGLTPTEIVVANRDWLLEGETFNWDYRIEPLGDHILMRRW